MPSGQTKAGLSHSLSLLPAEFTFIQRGWLNCNSILIQGDGLPALVDSGHLFYQDETLSLINQAGVEPETISQIATNHPDVNDNFNATAAIVDILPSIVTYLGLRAPDDIAAQLDGKSFIDSIEN